MGTASLDAADGLSQPVPATGGNVSVADDRSTGISNPLSYTPPPQEPDPIEARLTRGFTKSIAEAPQFLGQGLYYLGSNFNPKATMDEQLNGDSFGDRMARVGLAMTERNQKYIKENFPGDTPDDLWERVGGAVPMVGSLALGAMMGLPAAAAGVLAAGGAAQATGAAFSTLRAQGKSTTDADILANLVGAGAGSAMTIGMGNFLKATGPALVQVAKGVINGLTGGIAQSAAVSTLQLATGVQHFTGADSIKEAMADAVKTGVTFAILGGPLGLHVALTQHRAVQKGFQDLGLKPAAARDAASTAMAHGMHEGISAVEKEVKLTKDEARRIQIAKLYQPKPIDSTGAPRPDILDMPFIPTEPNKTEALTADLEAQKQNLKLIRRDIKDLREAVKANKSDQADIESESHVYMQARRALEQMQKEEGVLEQQIDKLQDRLKPKTTPDQEIGTQIAKLKQGFRAGKKITEGEIDFVQKEFNKLLDQSDLDLNDKAKFRKVLPQIQSEEEFWKAFPEIINKIDFMEQRAEQKQWAKEIKAVDLTKLPVEYQDALKPILDSFDFNRASRSVLIDRAKTLEFFKNKLASLEPGADSLAPGEQRALDLAAKKSLSEMSHDEQKSVYDAIMSVVNEGKLKNKYLSNLKQRNHEQWRAKFLSNLASAETVKRLNNLEKYRTRANQSPWEWLTGQRDALQQEQMTPELIMHVIGAEDEHQVLHEQYQKKIEGQRLAMETLQEIHNKADVEEALKDKVDVRLELPNSKVKIYEGKTALTGNDLLKIYAQSFDEGGLRHLENTFSEPGELSALLKFTSDRFPKQTAAVLKQFDYFRTDGYDRLNAVVRTMQGHNMSKLKFYDPLGGSLEERAGQDLIRDMKLGVKGMFGRALPESGMTVTRVQSKLALSKFDYYGDLVRNAMDRENYIAMAQVLRDMNKKFYDPLVVQALKERFGPNMVRVIHKWLQDAAFDGHQNDSATARMFGYLRTAFISKAIGFNPISAAKVGAQLSPASDFVGGMYVSKALKDYTFNRGKLDKFIDSKSLMMKNRYLRQERDFANLIDTKGASSLAGNAIKDQIVKLSMVMHQEMDKIVTRATWIGAYNKAQDQLKLLGGSEDDAIAAADSAVRYTHPMGGSLYLPDIFRGNEFQKAMTSFHSATNRNYNLLIKANREFENTSGGYFKWIKTQLGVGLIPAALIAALSLHRPPTKRELSLEYLNQTTGSDIYLGWLTMAMVSGRDVASTTPWTAFPSDLYNAAKGVKPETKLRYGLAAVDDLTSLSTSNIFRMLTGQMFAPRPHEGFMSKLDFEEPSDDGDFLRAGGI